MFFIFWGSTAAAADVYRSSFTLADDNFSLCLRQRLRRNKPPRFPRRTRVCENLMSCISVLIGRFSRSASLPTKLPLSKYLRRFWRLVLRFLRDALYFPISMYRPILAINSVPFVPFSLFSYVRLRSIYLNWRQVSFRSREVSGLSRLHLLREL